MKNIERLYAVLSKWLVVAGQRRERMSERWQAVGVGPHRE
jgi:hypothetical protein